MRFLLDGERLQEESTLLQLDLASGDVIEAFKECSGGGPPAKRHKCRTFTDEDIASELNKMTPKKIHDTNKDVLKISRFDHCEAIIDRLNRNESKQEKTYDDKVKKTGILYEDSREDNTCSEQYEEGNSAFELSEVGPSSSEEPEVTSKISECSEAVKSPQNEEKENDIWLEDLRLKIKKGIFNGTSSLHKQILYYMKLPKLQDFEKKLVKELFQRLELFSSLTIFNQENFPQKQKVSRKRKIYEPQMSYQRCLRRRKTISEESEENIKIFDDNDESLKNTTPNQRTKIFNVFGIVSPFIIKNVPTAEEVRRFSLAVHLWSEKCKGGVKFLHNIQLNERCVQDIILFAGPGSRWKLIPDRSVTEYLSIWQNASKGTEHFHGDPETGYQSKLRLHSPSIQFCPFAHCVSVPEICNSGSQTRKDKDEKNVENPIRRDLFGSEKTTKVKE